MDGPNILNGRHTNLGNTNLENIRNEILENNSGAIGVNWTEIRHTYNETKTNRSQTIKNIVTTQDYVSSSPNVTGKTDKNSDEPNFVTIYLASHSARQAVKDLDSWLFEYLEMNDDTKEMVDSTKYLLYVASGKDYGKVDFDFEEFTTPSSSFKSSTTNVANGDVKEKVWFTLRNEGYSEIAVAGVMGNISQESSWEPTTQNSIGAIGLCQWLDRAPKLRAYANSKGVEWSDVDTQIEFMLAELTPGGKGIATYQGGECGPKGYRIDNWKNANTPEEAAEAFCKFYERCGEKEANMQHRKEEAAKFYNMYKGKTQ